MSHKTRKWKPKPAKRPVARCQAKPPKHTPNLANSLVPIVARNPPNKPFLWESPNKLLYVTSQNYFSLAFSYF